MADDPTDDPIDDTADATDAEVDPAAPEVASSEPSKSAADQRASSTGADTAPPVVRKKVVSKRVTPKGGGAPGKGPVKGSTAARAHAPEGTDAGYSSRYTPPSAKYAPGPSPWWVPALMFGLLIVGALIIILNYAGVFGDADNIRLVIGLGFILGGIITATQLR